MINKLLRMPDNVNVTVTKKDLIDLITICIVKNTNARAKNFPDFLSTKQLSEYIGYSVPRIYQLVAKAAIPYYKIGSKLLFKRIEIDAWLLIYKQPTINKSIVESKKGGKTI